MSFLVALRKNGNCVVIGARFIAPGHYKSSPYKLMKPVVKNAFIFETLGQTLYVNPLILLGLRGIYAFIGGFVPADVKPSAQNGIYEYLRQNSLTINRLPGCCS
jgi:hypothetical protein